MIVILLALDMSFLLARGTFTNQSTSKYLEWDFDFVETFDSLQDWKGEYIPNVGNRWEELAPGTFPKLLDGRKSSWTYYSMWSEINGDYWIDDHGTEKVWTGQGKSLRIDLGGTGSGPSRFGLYFGDGTATSGYDGIYIFHMVKISENQWPTRCEQNGQTVDCIGGSPLGIYQEGNKYAYILSWKFGTLNMGRDGQFSYNGVDQPYSPYHVIPHIKKYSYAPLFGKYCIKLEPNDAGIRGNYEAIEKSIEDFLPDWWGVEFHFRNIAEQEANYTCMDVWIYDEYGNGWHVLDNSRMQYTSQPAKHKWNDWYFGGNNSASYSWGPTMESPYYVDDFIIDDQRIGPKYFNFLKSSVINNSSLEIQHSTFDIQFCPNPFQHGGTINCQISEPGHVNLAVYKQSGQLVSQLYNGTGYANKISVAWNGKDMNGNTLTNGIYFCQLQNDDQIFTKKILLIK